MNMKEGQSHQDRDRGNSSILSKASRALRGFKIGDGNHNNSNVNKNKKKSEDLPWGGTGMHVAVNNDDAPANGEANENHYHGRNQNDIIEGIGNINDSAKKNTKKLDEFGFIVNIDDTGALRDENSVRIPGGAYTPSADACTPKRNQQKKNLNPFHKRTSSLTKRAKQKIKSKNKSNKDFDKTDETGMSKRQKKAYQKLMGRREKKWIDMLNNWDPHTQRASLKTPSISNSKNHNGTNGSGPSSPTGRPKSRPSQTTTSASNLNKLRQRIRKGIPNSVRGKAWVRIAGVHKKVEITQKGVYAKLVSLSCEDQTENGVAYGNELGLENFGNNVEVNVDHSIMKETIERDLTRTFPRHNMFYDSHSDDDSDEESGDESYDKVSHSGSFDSFPSTGDEDDDGNVNVEVIMDNQGDHGQSQDLNIAATKSTTADDAFRSASPPLDESCLAKVTANCPPSLFSEKKEELFVTINSPSPQPISPSSDNHEQRQEHHGNFQQLQKPKKKTKPKVIDFSVAEGGQAKLRRVLRAYSIYDTDVGYCQGMNFIAGMFITFMEEEEAFWLLVNVMTESPCRMRGLFGEGMSEAHQVLHVAERLILQFHPKLAKHFERQQIHITMFATQWLLTMYTSSFPFDVVTRVWDAFLSEGWKVAYRIMLALLEKAQPLLMKMQFEEILNYFKEMPFELDSNELLEMAFKIPLKKKHITKYAKEWEKMQIEKEKKKQQAGR